MTTALAAFTLASFAGPAFVTFAKPEAGTIALQAVVSIGELGPRDELALMAVTDSMIDGTEEFSKPQLRRWGGQTGRPLQVELMPGFVRIGISVPKGQGSLGASMMDSLLRRASFSKTSLDEWTANAKAIPEDYWATALWPTRPRSRDLRQSDVPEAYRRWFRPENVTIGLGGAFTPEEESKLRARFEGWTAPRTLRPIFDGGYRSPALSNRTRVSTIEIRSEGMRPGDVDFPLKLAAVFALGVGKSSSLFRIAREKSGFSYRQEAILWPTVNGFDLRMIIARADPAFGAGNADEWRLAMLAEVETWTEANLAAAKGIAEASLRYGIGFQPIYLSGRSALDSSIEDQTLLRAYWFSKTKSNWDGERLVEEVRKTSIDELKERAKAILQNAKSHAILGMGKPE